MNINKVSVQMKKKSWKMKWWKKVGNKKHFVWETEYPTWKKQQTYVWHINAGELKRLFLCIVIDKWDLSPASLKKRPGFGFIEGRVVNMGLMVHRNGMEWATSSNSCLKPSSWCGWNEQSCVPFQTACLLLPLTLHALRRYCVQVLCCHSDGFAVSSVA